MATAPTARKAEVHVAQSAGQCDFANVRQARPGVPVGSMVAQAVLDFMGAPAQTALKQRHGMEPAGA